MLELIASKRHVPRSFKDRDTAIRVIVAFDSFKGSISARDASNAFREGWLSVQPNASIQLLPVADGGEGTLDAFEAAHESAIRKHISVLGPDDRVHQAEWLLLPPTPDAPAGTGVVELGLASGIELLGEQRLPWSSHTFGLGQAIGAALDHGVSKVLIGLGSSASTDAGVGMLTALGARFTDRNGSPVPLGAQGLSKVHHVDLSTLRKPPTAGSVAMVDVTNPLLGPEGAAAVFGPQKGLSGHEITEADRALQHIASFFDLNPQEVGNGAAGGTGFAMRLWGADLVSGSATVAEGMRLRERIAQDETAKHSGPSDLNTIVIVGEGSFDEQSAAGKAPFAVAQIAQSCGARIGLVAGRIAMSSPDLFSYQVSLSDLACSTRLAIEEPARWLREAGAQLARDTSR